MALPHKIEEQLTIFLKPKIVFNRMYNQYMFNGHWLIDITEDTFKIPILNLINNVNSHLVVGANNKNFLLYLKDKTEEKIDWLHQYKFLDINYITDLTSIIKTIDNMPDTIPPPAEKYSIDFLKNCSPEQASKIMEENNYYADSFYFDGLKQSNYLEQIDFEIIKLRFVLQLYYDFLLLLFQYFDNILINIENINFSAYDFSELVQDLGLIETHKNNLSFTKKCHVNLNKKETAQLFTFLMQENFFTFDTIERKNRAQLTKFIETNFTYMGEENTKSIIKNLNQEFTHLLHPDEKNQLPFINKLISILQERKSKLT